MLEFIIRSLETFPSMNACLALTLIALAGLILPTLLITLAQINTDAFSVDHMFDPVRVYHFIFIFPLMCIMMLIRFGIQHRDKMYFFIFEFTTWETSLVHRIGLWIKEDYMSVTYQNAFGAKFDGADCTTTVYRHRPEDKKPWNDRNTSLKYRYILGSNHNDERKTR